jgi:hypothetical protein
MSCGTPKEHFLETEQSKLQFFTKSCRLSADVLPAGGTGTHRFPDRFPVSTLEQAGQTGLTIRFAFIDEGLFSLRKFERFVLEYEKLFRALGRFTVVYVSDSQRNFKAAAKCLARRLPKCPDGLSGEDFPLGIEHFLDYLEVRDVFHNTCRVLTQEGLDLLEEGERIYTSPVHGQLETDWSQDRITCEQISEQYARGQSNARFEGLLLAFKYPVLDNEDSTFASGHR